MDVCPIISPNAPGWSLLPGLAAIDGHEEGRTEEITDGGGGEADVTHAGHVLAVGGRRRFGPIECHARAGETLPGDAPVGGLRDCRAELAGARDRSQSPPIESLTQLRSTTYGPAEAG